MFDLSFLSPIVIKVSKASFLSVIQSPCSLGTNIFNGSFLLSKDFKSLTIFSFLIENYNDEVEKYLTEKSKNPKINLESIIETDAKKISWTSDLKTDLTKGIKHSLLSDKIALSAYRPYCLQNIYLTKDFIYEYSFVATKMFPNPNLKNFVICVSGVGVTKDFSTIITNVIPDLELIGKSQCFPLYYYEENISKQKGIFDDDNKNDYIRRDAISDFILEHSKKHYGTNNISKEDIFYYVYGILHSPEYRETFSNDLKKMLPRIPLVDDVRDFWSFSKSGRELSELHLNYEQVPRYDGVNVIGEESGFFKVEKMRFPKKDQKDTIIYNSKISIQNIPSEAYEYVVNGKSAIEWVMERYQITTHKESQITNDPNDWSEEVGNPRYILDLILSVINVSVQTVEIVKNLPKLKLEQ